MTAPPLIDVNADPALARALEIAAFVGPADADATNVSYTSLFIGLIWADDPTSVWLERRLDAKADGGSAIFKGRKVDRGQRGSILGLVDSGRAPVLRSDPVSISARTVLAEARSLATETKLPAEAPLGTRHVAAVYFFRNPPGHTTQFHSEWGFEKEEWRRAFAEFIEQQYSAEAPAWAQVLAGYIATPEPVEQRVPGNVFGSFSFDNEAVLVMRALEFLSSLKTPAYLGTAGLLDTLAGARSIPDGAAFADLAADRLGIKTPWTAPPNTSPFATEGISLQISRGLKEVLDTSRSMARSTTGTAVVGVRHLIASILINPGSTANQKLSTSGLSLPMLRERLLKTFSRRWLNDDGLQWRQILVGSTIATVTDINPDSADKGDDRLNVTRYARAFATLIAADRVSPPLSVGIFGDWGSGKSFFMRLMSEHTQTVAAFEDRGSDGKRLFCRNVVSIRFNAWHYAETELLASLVQTILLGLREAIVGKGGEDSDLMDKVLAKLEIAKIARSEAQARLDAARAEQLQSQILLNQAQLEANEKAEAVRTVQARDVVLAVREVLLPEMNTDQALRVAETYLGLDGIEGLKKSGERTVGDVKGVVDDVRVTAARTRSAWDWLLRAPVDTRQLGRWAAAMLVILAAGLAVSGWAKMAWPAFYGIAINAIGVVVLGAGWARRHLITISRGLDQFDEIRRRIAQKIEAERSKTQTELVQAQAQHEAALKKVMEADDRLKDAQAAIEKAEQDVRDSRSISRIAKLLEERIAGKSYERYLGIVAAVRMDFQRLSDLMKTMRTDIRADAALADAGALRSVDRIVLYIDDLDRCPADKVVAVLEAIHLLLAFELFVVVVGVDIRWAAKSLVKKYPEHLTAGVYEGGGAAAAVAPGVTALDYLEKIFQIPFWLPPMEEDASRNMMAEMLPRPAVSEVKESSGGAPEETALPAQEVQQQQAAATDIVAAEQTAGGNAQSMVIEPGERNFMLQLAGAVGKSPRRLKRFVNTYRILKASLDKLQQDAFVANGGAKGEYKAAMVLLAMVTAAPRSSLGMLDFLANSEDTAPVDDFVAYINVAPDLSESMYALAALQVFKGTETGVTLKLLRDWAPQVSRFSFRSGPM